MILSDIAVRRPITTIMFFAAIVILGIVSVVRLPMQILPDISPPRGGAFVRLNQELSPEEFERKIIEPLEGEIAQLPNIKNVQVRSRGGDNAFFMIEFEFGVNIKYRIVELQDRLDQFRRTFPRNYMNVNAFPFETAWLNTELMELELVGPREDPYLEGLDIEKIRQQLQNIDGVAEADLWGGRERTVDVQIMQDRLREFGVGMFSVRQTVETFASEPVFLGNIEEGKQRFFVRLNGQFKDTGEVEDVIVKSDGNIAIRHLGEVNDYYRSRRQLRRYDGQPSVGMELGKEAEVNILDLSNRAKVVIAHINESLPPGYQIKVEWDQADEIREMLWTLTNLAMMGIFLSMLVLYAFVRNWKMTLIVCLVIPICVVATFNFMYFSGMTINMLTLMGLAVGVGVLIDSSIVVLENVFRHHEQGKDAEQASTIGAHEVGVAVFALTLTNVVVFLPIIFIEGEIRLMFAEGALALIYPMMLSMLVALTLVPMATSKILKFSKRKPRVTTQPAFQEAKAFAFKAPAGFQLPVWVPTMLSMKKQYGKLLKSCLRHRVRLFLAIVMVCMYTYFYTMSKVSQDVLEPPEDYTYFEVYVYLPEGTKQTHTVEVTGAVEDIIIENVPERHHISSRIEEDFAEIWVRLKDPDERERESPEIKESLRPIFEAFGSAEVTFEYVRNRGEDLQPNVDTGRSGVIEIRGPEYAQIDTIAQTFIEQAVLVPGVRDVQSETEGGPLEVHFIIDRDTAAHLQITPQTVAQAIQSAQRRGDSSTIEMKKGDRDIMIVFSQVEELIDVTQQEEVREDGIKFEELMDVPVFSPTVGSTVSLSELGRFELRRGMGEVQRENQERIGRILFQTAPDANYSEVERAMETLIENYPIKAGYRMTMGGRSRVLDENIAALQTIAWLAIILVYMCMAALFESFTKPLVVVFSVPLAIIGIVWTFILTNSAFTETAGLGLVFLIGILPNSAILLVHYASYLIRHHNYPRERAVMQSGYNRLRPIFMTVLTTNLGLLPMAWEVRGSEEWTPFARCVIGGLTSSTILTLIIVPGFYFIVEDIVHLFNSIIRYITSWRWIFVFWSRKSRSAYREKLTAYRHKPKPEEPLQIEVEYLVRIYSQPYLEKLAGKIKQIFAFNAFSTATAFIPQTITPPAAVSTQARKKALDGVSFILEPGIYGLLGPNGAGKTTLLRLLAGIDQPTRGFLSICGYDMKKSAREAQQCIGYLPQEFGVYSHLTAEKYLDYFALLKGIRDAAERKRVVNETLEMVNLSDQRHVPVGQFSGGMKRRIGLAQIFVKPPKILIVDEPTVGLDPVERVRFRNLLAKLSQNRIVILSTHIVDDVAHTCKRLGVMNQGKLLYDGSASEFIQTVQGKVWEMEMASTSEGAFSSSNHEWREFRRKYQIVGQHHTADGIHLRIVSDTPPAAYAVNVEPTLEDAYIYHTHVKQQ